MAKDQIADQAAAKQKQEMAETVTDGTAKTATKTDAPAKYTDADVDRIVEKRFARWQKEQEAKVSEAKKLASMDEQEKNAYRIQQLEKEVTAYKEKESRSAMIQTARGMLANQGIETSDDLVEMLVSSDAEKTKAAVDDFAKVFNQAVEAAVKTRLKGSTPAKNVGKGSMTKKDILAIKDPELRQQKMLENRELFNF
jgi:hypothetical protein